MDSERYIKEKREFQSSGFLIVKKFFKDQEILPLREACHADPTIRGSVVALSDSSGNAQELTCWTELGDDLLGIFPRMARVVSLAQALLNEPVYHWHSKLSLKRPHTAGRWDWHQDYPYWYHEGCLYPVMLTCTIAIDPSTVANGCLQVLSGSHRMGRINHIQSGPTTAVDPERLHEAMKRHPLIDCEMDPGDALFFHGNLLHASGGNGSDMPRTLLHMTYNAVSNAPYKVAGQEQHAYRPLDVLPDDIVLNGGYRSAFSNHIFPSHRKDLSVSRYGQAIVQGIKNG